MERLVQLRRFGLSGWNPPNDENFGERDSEDEVSKCFVKFVWVQTIPLKYSQRENYKEKRLLPQIFDKSHDKEIESLGKSRQKSNFQVILQNLLSREIVLRLVQIILQRI